jgi:hypothetical protein
MYANLSLIVQQYGLGSNYGYVCGGYTGSNDLSTIDRFQFPFDSGTASYVGNLSENRSSLSANNSSTYGYVCGGYSFDSDTMFSTIDRFQFPFNSGTANQVGNLSGNRGLLSANNSSTHGYVCGGYYSGIYFSTIDRFQFPFSDGTASYVGDLSGSRYYLRANNSSTYGYVCGGYSFDNGSQQFSTIDRFQFPFDSGTANHIGNLSGSRYGLSANNSSTYGYVCGGWSYSSSQFVSTIDRFQFPFNSGTASKVGSLSGNRGWLRANNSSTYGYVCGGYYSAHLSTIDRFQFPFNSGTANYVGNLSGSRRGLSATDGVDFVTMFV